MASLQRIICPVTGGASGLGRATAQRLIRNGARVVITDLPTSDGDNVAKELRENSCYFAYRCQCGVQTMAKFAIIFVYRHNKKLAVKSLCIIIKEKFSH